ncbi:zinc-dependent alcohol dehydrogenase [Thermasporomyces composti]|jgi:2-desacetyl-2-hydroxyethyl bacteriochlorophyllide A dehydrogenase|uniref:2-desacetyl-2-hydroxyethyl bacteriochlorophyllide A dehydrogenase n=1 Tax=Thermasporomyces composti TaxID=696763 RepID=A0A3D9V3G3_THECX|nr:alcohol dehydrogenase catalytic domain-containing protein [Thermasporomyces composti]REF36258.1 2-desacetyl-2-hydroxyethyl bacteriochlorophyllide A dehydrogenase [Thermasporomyces composti]
MRAAVYIGNRALRVEDRDPVPPGPGEVQIAVAYAGICGTDLHIRHGAMDDRALPPAVLGHEAVGRIAALGAGVSGWRVGDPVTVMPLRWCGDCAACRAGHNHVCQRLRVLGVDLPGAMQARWTVPADVVLRLPEEVPLADAALVEPTAVAVHDVRRAEVRAGEHVVVVGAGPIGLLIAVVAAAEGAEIVVVEPDPYRRGVAERLGLAAVDPTSTDVPAYVAERTAGAGAAVAFEVSGSPAGMRIATDVLGVRGRLVVVAIHPDPVPVDLNQVFLRELTVLGARVYARADVERAIELVHRGVVPARELVSRIVPLSAVAEAFDALESADGVVKVLLDCQAAG